MATKKPTKTQNPDRTIGNLAAPVQEISPQTVADLRPAGYNPRTITADQQKMLKGSLEEFGDIGVIIFNRRTGRLIGGHQRSKLLDPNWPIVKEAHDDGKGTVAKGYIQTPFGHLTYREVDWDEQKEKAANVAANKHGGQFDDDLLAQLLQELNNQGYDMALTGFDDDELKALLDDGKNDNLGEEDPEVEPVPDPFVKLGDLWVCGDSRILCGDSTSIADIDRLMMGEKADLCCMDPPYNITYESKAGKIANDDMSDAEFKKFLLSVYSMMDYALKPGAAFYIWHADDGDVGETFRNALKEIKTLMNKQTIIWVKSSATLSRKDYNQMHESALYGWKAGSAHWYDGDFTRTTVINDDIDLSKMSAKEVLAWAKKAKEALAGPVTVWNEDKPSKNTIHPTMKPVRLFERSIYANSRPGDVVIDLFNGSGTNTIACRKTGRKGRGMEMSPNYLQASLVRYQEFCGEEPQLMLPDGKLVPFSKVKKEREKIGK